MKKTLTALALALASLATWAAPTYVYDYTFDGASTTTNASAAGSQLQVGQSVGLTLRAAGNDFFQVTAPYGAWVPLRVLESGTRVGDLNFTAWLDGIAVATGSYSGLMSMYVHIAQPATLAQGVRFDVLNWEFTLSATNSANNTLDDLLLMNDPTASTTDYVRGQAVPEPSSVLLLATALGGLWARRRSAKA